MLNVTLKIKTLLLLSVLLLSAFMVYAADSPSSDWSDKLLIITTPNKAEYSLKDKITLSVILRNVSDEDIRIGTIPFDLSSFHFTVTGADQQELSTTPYGEKIFTPPSKVTANTPIKIAPGYQRRYTFELNKMYPIHSAGIYTVVVTRKLVVPETDENGVRTQSAVVISSPPITINIAGSKTEANTLPKKHTTETHASTAKIVAQKKLAFVRDGDIWIADYNGAHQKLTIHKGRSPVWSPNHLRIAFVRDGNIWIANNDGSGQHALTYWKTIATPEGNTRYEGARNIAITWSPDGQHLACSRWESFVLARYGNQTGSAIAGCTISIVSINAKPETNPKPLIDFFSSGVHFYPSVNNSPAWSYSGLRIAFVRNGDIWITGHDPLPKDAVAPVSIFGWNWKTTRLATPARYDGQTQAKGQDNYIPTYLSWSPDGQYLAYGYQKIVTDETDTSKKDTSQVRLLHIKRNKLKSITATEDTFLAVGSDPVVSPDAQFVAYTVRNGYVNEIHTISIDGGKEHTVVKNGEEPAL